MRIRALPLALAGAALALAACSSASAPMGTVAGNAIGGTAWVAVKTTKLAFKGGKFAVKTTGRTVKGAAKGVHEEFSSKPDEEAQTKAAAAKPAQVALSQSESTTLPY